LSLLPPLSFILLLTAGYEIWERFGESGIGVHHGVAIFGLIQVVKSIPEIMHGLKECQEGEDGFHKNMGISEQVD
jgi:hypothetical protein